MARKKESHSKRTTALHSVYYLSENGAIPEPTFGMGDRGPSPRFEGPHGARDAERAPRQIEIRSLARLNY